MAFLLGLMAGLAITITIFIVTGGFIFIKDKKYEEYKENLKLFTAVFEDDVELVGEKVLKYFDFIQFYNHTVVPLLDLPKCMDDVVDMKDMIIPLSYNNYIMDGSDPLLHKKLVSIALWYKSKGWEVMLTSDSGDMLQEQLSDEISKFKSNIDSSPDKLLYIHLNAGEIDIPCDKLVDQFVLKPSIKIFVVRESTKVVKKSFSLFCLNHIYNIRIFEDIDICMLYDLDAYINYYITEDVLKKLDRSLVDEFSEFIDFDMIPVCLLEDGED